MIFGDKYVFLELAKTGSTYARYVLKRLKNGNSQAVGKKHNTYRTLTNSQKVEFDSKIKIGSIRNPFDWYVSQFAFGCEHRGGLYYKTRIRPDILAARNLGDFFIIIINHFKNKRKWKNVFTDVNDKENFENFLNLLFSIDPLGPGFRFKLSGAHKKMGFYTYSYFRIFTYDFDENADQVGSYKDLNQYHDENYLIDIMLRNENLKNDLLKFSEVICSGEIEMKESIESRPKRSKTATIRNKYPYYYTDKTKQMVLEKDKFIFERYAYKF